MPLTDFPERFDAMESIALYKNGQFFRELEIFDVRYHGEIIILTTDLENRDEAEECVGADILIEPDERVKLPDGNFWVDDLIGLQVEDMNGNVLGTVTDMLSAGANELYEIRDSAGKLHYIPAVEEFVRDIRLDSQDRSKGYIRVALIDGLWD